MKLAAYYSRLTHYSAPVDGLGGSSTGTYMCVCFWSLRHGPSHDSRIVPCRAVQYTFTHHSPVPERLPLSVDVHSRVPSVHLDRMSASITPHSDFRKPSSSTRPLLSLSSASTAFTYSPARSAPRHHRPGPLCPATWQHGTPRWHRFAARHGLVQADNAMRCTQILPRCPGRISVHESHAPYAPVERGLRLAIVAD